MHGLTFKNYIPYTKNDQMIDMAKIIAPKMHDLCPSTRFLYKLLEIKNNGCLTKHLSINDNHL